VGSPTGQYWNFYDGFNEKYSDEVFFGLIILSYRFSYLRFVLIIVVLYLSRAWIRIVTVWCACPL